MRAAIADAPGTPLAVRDVEPPGVAAGEILLEVHACGICYTDVRIVDAIGGPFMPLIPGHEPVGRIAAVGAGVTNVAVGDRVGVHALFTCDECQYCLAGEEEACDKGLVRLAGLGLPGGYAEYMRAPASHAIPLPDNLSFADAAPFFCAGLTTYAALKNGGLRPGQRVAVLGIGGLGHLGIEIAKAMGATVYAVTGTPAKASLARELGATFAGAADEVVRELKAAGGAHVALHTANSLDPVAAILPGMARQGAIVLTSGGGDHLPVPPGMFTSLQLRVVGSFYGSRQDMREVLDLAARHNIRPIIERYTLESVNEAYERLRAGDVRYRAVLLPRASG